MPADRLIWVNDIPVVATTLTTTFPPPNDDLFEGDRGSVRVPESTIRRLSAEKLGQVVQQARKVLPAVNLQHQIDNIISQARIENAPTSVLERLFDGYSVLTSDEEEYVTKEMLAYIHRAEEELMERRKAEEEDSSEPEKGYVYLAYCSTGHHKIGRSKSPDDRIEHFDTQMPVDVWEKAVFPSTDYKKTESTLHNWLSEYRVKGEWFDLTRDQESAIQHIDYFDNGWFVFDRDAGPMSRSKLSRDADWDLRKTLVTGSFKS